MLPCDLVTALFAMLAVGVGCECVISCARSEDVAIEFDRDIRPLLSDRCFRCHGPDGASREAELRLDRRDEAVADRNGTRIITPGNPAASEFYRRITAVGDEQMPPADSNLKLSKAEIDLLRRWIESGAEYKPHWAFTPPQAVPLPPVRNEAWAKNDVDRFVLASLEKREMTPSPEASKATWLRRVSLDLTGLPPTLAELDAFLADDEADAYERVVDRLLASPRYGERMALDWLDAARYADTNGYYNDSERQAWPWRDWVIGPSTRTCRSISSPSSNSPATCCPMRRSISRSRPASIAITW